MVHEKRPPSPSLSPLFEEGLTFDDVLLIPSYSSVLPHATDISSQFSRHIGLRVPLVSAAMDTVTESRLAIAMAEAGGIGVIHKNLDVKTQSREVKKVKKYESGIVSDPVTIHPSATLKDAQELKRKYMISGIPVVDEKGKLHGIITNRDLRFAENTSDLVSSVMTKDNLITASKDITWNDARRLLHHHRIEKLLIVDEAHHLTGLMTVKDIEKAERHPNANRDDKGRLRVAAALSVEKHAMQRAEALLDEEVDGLVVDSAHGHTQGVTHLVSELKSWGGNRCDIIAGNVATAEGAQALIDAGADAIKVGIGPGSICTTRVVAGVGVPQWSAIKNVAVVCKKAGIPLIADGGIRHSGDIAKAIAVGADNVMIGSLFAGTDESPGETFHYGGRPCKVYRGMGSMAAMAAGSASRYFQSESRSHKNSKDGLSKFVPEGVEGQVPYKGALSDILYQLVGGLRSSMGYIGAATISEMRDKARFCRITSAGLSESHVHGVMMTRQAPNYQTDA